MYIPDYQMLSVMSSDTFLCNHVWFMGWYCYVTHFPPPM